MICSCSVDRITRTWLISAVPTDKPNLSIPLLHEGFPDEDYPFNRTLHRQSGPLIFRPTASGDETADNGHWMSGKIIPENKTPFEDGSMAQKKMNG
jgi:hypothetical protein